MKRLLITLNVVLVLIYLGMNTASATCHYTSFQEIDFVEGGSLLRDINTSDYYDNVKKRMLAGWRIHIINDGVKVKYKTETLLDYTNAGTTPIEYVYTKTNKDVVKFGISVSDQMDKDVSGSVEKFKVGLSNKLKISGEYEKQATSEEQTKIKIDVDPNTQLLIYEVGEGRITNGVAAAYTCFVRTARGGFEYFVPTTQYQKIIKRKI